MAGLRDLSVGRFVLPRELLSVKFARSGGPGGQNVNKVASKVDLRLDLAGASAILGPDNAQRVQEKLRARLDRDGQLLVISSEHRDQAQNIEAAIARVEALLAEALHRPKHRVATRATRGSKERRLRDKRVRAEIKRGRKDTDST